VEHLRRLGDAYNSKLTITESSPACARLYIREGNYSKHYYRARSRLERLVSSIQYVLTRVLLCQCLESGSVHPQSRPLKLASDCARPCLLPGAPAPRWLHHQAGRVLSVGTGMLSQRSRQCSASPGSCILAHVLKHCEPWHTFST
jgi:hypothetical protein